MSYSKCMCVSLFNEQKKRKGISISILTSKLQSKEKEKHQKESPLPQQIIPHPSW